MILESVRRHAARRHALVTPSRVWTYGDLARAARTISSVLSSRSADPVALVMTAEGEDVAALLATEWLQYPTLLLPAAIEPSAFQSFAARSGAGCILLPPSAHVLRDAFPADAATARAGRLLCLFPQSGHTANHAPDSWLLQLTSGSLAPPRIAARTHDGIMSEVHAVAERISLSPTDRVLCATSVAHSYALIGGTLASLFTGAEVVLPGTSGQIVEMTIRHQPTVLFGVRNTYEVLLAGADPSGVECLRLALSAGAPLPATLAGEVLRRLGISIRQDYGTTETGTIAIDMSDQMAPNVVGTPLPHMEVRTAPSDRPALNQIVVRSSSVARVYVGPYGAEPAVDGNGWYRPGDAGHFDEHGRLVLQGRIRPHLTIDGTAIAPEEIEEIILACPGVGEVAVVAVADSRGAQVFKAVVVGHDMAAVERWCAEQLPPGLRPHIIEGREVLPRSPAGKILYSMLA